MESIWFVRWCVSFVMCVHRSERREVSNGACGTFSGGAGSESKAARGQCTGDFRVEQGTLLVVVESVGTLGEGSLWGEGIRRCGVRVCEILYRRRPVPESLRARGQVHS